MADSHSTHPSCTESLTRTANILPSGSPERLNCPGGDFTSEPPPMNDDDIRNSQMDKNTRSYHSGPRESTIPSYPTASTSRATTDYFTQRDEIMEIANAPSPVTSAPAHDIIPRRLATDSPTSQTPLKKLRNLVICIDGTSNQFGMMVR